MESDPTLREVEYDAMLNEVDYDPALIKLARKRAGAKLGFYIHAVIFVGINSALIWVWWYENNSLPWLLVLVFWGLGLALHGGIAFEGLHIVDRMEERQLEKLSQEGDAMSEREALTRRREGDATLRRKD